MAHRGRPPRRALAAVALSGALMVTACGPAGQTGTLPEPIVLNPAPTPARASPPGAQPVDPPAPAPAGTDTPDSPTHSSRPAPPPPAPAPPRADDDAAHDGGPDGDPGDASPGHGIDDGDDG